MKKLLQQKKDLNSGSTLYQFIEEVGEQRFYEHLRSISNLMKLANNINQFDFLFEKTFGKPQSTLFPELEEAEFMKIFNQQEKAIEVEQREIKKEKKATKTEQDNLKSDKFIRNIQADNLEFKDNDFENAIFSISFSKKKD